MKLPSIIKMTKINPNDKNDKNDKNNPKDKRSTSQDKANLIPIESLSQR